MTQRHGASHWGTLRVMPVRALIFVIAAYRQMVSPLRLPSCRFIPTCSQYAVEALEEFGLLRGSWLSLVRLTKCGPWHRGGWDPIPERPGDGDRRAGRRESGIAGECRESTQSVV